MTPQRRNTSNRREPRKRQQSEAQRLLKRTQQPGKRKTSQRRQPIARIQFGYDEFKGYYHFSDYLHPDQIAVIDQYIRRKLRKGSEDFVDMKEPFSRVLNLQYLNRSCLFNQLFEVCKSKVSGPSSSGKKEGLGKSRGGNSSGSVERLVSDLQKKIQNSTVSLKPAERRTLDGLLLRLSSSDGGPVPHNPVLILLAYLITVLHLETSEGTSAAEHEVVQPNDLSLLAKLFHFLGFETSIPGRGGPRKSSHPPAEANEPVLAADQLLDDYRRHHQWMNEVGLEIVPEFNETTGAYSLTYQSTTETPVLAEPVNDYSAWT